MHIILYMCLSLSIAPQLLSNITRWEGLLPSASIQQLSVDGLVNRYLLLSLQNCPIDNYTVEKTKFVSGRCVLSAFIIHTPFDIQSIPPYRLGSELLHLCLWCSNDVAEASKFIVLSVQGNF